MDGLNGRQEMPPAVPASDGSVTFAITKRSQVDVLAVSAVFIFLPSLAVALRLLARRVARRRLNASDYTIVASCVSSLKRFLSWSVLINARLAPMHFKL